MSKTLPCEVCCVLVPQPETGRPRKYCGPKCKKAAHKARHTQEPELAGDSCDVVVVAQDEVNLDALDMDQLRATARGYRVDDSGDDREALIERILVAAGGQDHEQMEPAEPETETELPDESGDGVPRALRNWMVRDIKPARKRRMGTKARNGIRSIW